MRLPSLAFRLCAATALTGAMLGPLSVALAQPAPQVVTPAQQAENPPERVGWLQRLSGSVSFHTAAATQWGPASPNYPVASGDALWTQPNASARVVISASSVAMAGGTEFDVTTLDPNGLQATVPQGEVYLNLRRLAPSEAWSVQTPRGLVTFTGDGEYGVVAGDTQDPTTVTVLQGAAQISGPGFALQVAAGQTASVTGAQSFQAGVGPAQQDAFLAAMLQAQQATPPAAAPPPVVAQMPGGDDLSAYGSWSDTSDYGEVWYPQVASGWVPYREGHWAYVPPWGWTWVDDEPWGFAPFHYGRWVEIGGRWAWTPGVVAVAAPPIYAPALVAFFGVGVGMGAAIESGRVGWCPLGPHEAYHPWYHASDAYLRAVNRRDVTNVTLINRPVEVNRFVNHTAVTVVPAAAMAGSRPVRQAAVRVDPRELAAAHPVVGTTPIRPTAATAGITPGLAQQMHLPAAPRGAAVAHVAPGPAIHAMPPVHGVAARPPLPALVAHPPGAPTHGSERPVGVVPPRGLPGTPAPGQPQLHGAPPLRSPAAREAGPPPIEAHPEAGHPGPAPGTVHPGGPTGLEAHPMPAVHVPETHVAPPVHTVSPVHGPSPELRPAPQPGPSRQPEAHPAPAPHIVAPEVHAPSPQVHAPEAHPLPHVVGPEMHAPEPHPAPAPRPMPEMHAPPARPAPEMRAPPARPAPEMHASPPRPAPAPQARPEPAHRAAPERREDQR